MDRVRVVITSPLSAENVATIAAVDPRLEVVYAEDLIPAPEYPSAHPLPRLDGPDAERRWIELLQSAEILFDFGPLEMAERLPSWPHLRWIQATSAGVGQLAWRVGLTERRDIMITTASGVTFIAATDDSRIRAYDTRTGRELWTYKLPASAHTNPITYSVGGRQYLAIVSTGGSFLATPIESDQLTVFALPERARP